MKYYVLTFCAAACCLAQQQPTSSSSSTYTYDINGRPVPQVSFSDNASPGAERKMTTFRSANGRDVPVQSVEEHIISNAGGVKVIERTVRKFDANGNPGPPEKVRIEDRKNPDGTENIVTTTLRGDINGNLVPAERLTTDVRKSGDTTTSTTQVERSTVNGGFGLVAKTEATTRESANGDSSQNATTYQRDLNGNFTPTAREDVQRTTRNGVVEENAARYEATNGQMGLVEQTVSKTTKAGNGEHTEVNVFAPAIAGYAREAGSAPQLREQRVIEKSQSGRGAVETLSVRTTSPNHPNQLGPAQKVQETVCTGDCK